MQDHATPIAAELPTSEAERRAEPAATPQATAVAPQPIDAELLAQIGGAGMLYSPVNRW